jgi:hypothetical protein
MEHKRRKTDSRNTERIAAQVFLRSRSGKSFRDLQHSTPTDIAEYQPDEATWAAAREAFEALGFRVFSDSTGIALTIEGPSSLFTRVFRASKSKMKQSLLSPRPLSAPKEIMNLVEEIHVLPAPDLHAPENRPTLGP